MSFIGYLRQRTKSSKVLVPQTSWGAKEALAIGGAVFSIVFGIVFGVALSRLFLLLLIGGPLFWFYADYCFERRHGTRKVIK